MRKASIGHPEFLIESLNIDHQRITFPLTDRTAVIERVIGIATVLPPLLPAVQIDQSPVVIHASDEHGPNSAPYMVLSHTGWKNRFHGDRGIVGRTVRLNKHPYTIIGVTPPGFTGVLVFNSPELFVPLVNQEQMRGENVLEARAIHSSIFQVFGHLKKRVTPDVRAASRVIAGGVSRKTRARRVRWSAPSRAATPDRRSNRIEVLEYDRAR